MRGDLQLSECGGELQIILISQEMNGTMGDAVKYITKEGVF
jgi:hypothetical protein